ncbi:hypothetical protein P261_02700 [Lachnospiraceae bacterium TWA4]|nr:hypothetical protein P261_02700 [Lachnospiraceae bacterium TWA4]
MDENNKHEPIPTEKQLEVIKKFCLLDDIFFEAFIRDLSACQELLQVLLEDEKLVVNQIIPQNSIKSLIGRSVRLDALCTLGNGKFCNVEVQRSDNDHHLKRIRYNSSLITTSTTKTGSKFKEITDVIVIYISEFDFLKDGRVMYHIDPVVRETGKVVDNGVQIVCVNTVNVDESKVSQLMQLFEESDFNSSKFPNLSNRMKYMKHDEGGRKEMCELMDKYTEDLVKESEARGEARGKLEGEIKKARETAIKLYAKNTTLEDIADLVGFSVEKIKEWVLQTTLA